MAHTAAAHHNLPGAKRMFHFPVIHGIDLIVHKILTEPAPPRLRSRQQEHPVLLLLEPEDILCQKGKVIVVGGRGLNLEIKFPCHGNVLHRHVQRGQKD